MFSTVKAIGAVILAAVIGAAIGGGSGYFIGKSRERAQAMERHVKSLQEVRKADHAAVSNAQAESKALSDDIEESRERFSGVQAEIRRNYEPRKERKHVVIQPVFRDQPSPAVASKDGADKGEPVRQVARTEVEVAIAVGTDYLDVATVCLLNAARSDGAATRASCGGDAASETPSEVTVEDLAVSDADISRRYNELMKRHNTLVDWAEKVQADQRRRLGILDQ